MGQLTHVIIPSPPKHPPLHRSKSRICNRREPKRQREPYIPAGTIGPDEFPHGADEPCLRHAHCGADNADAGGGDGGYAGWEPVGGGVY